MYNMQEDFIELLQQASKLKESLEQRADNAFKDIEKISDEKTRMFLKNSLTLAKNGSLDIAKFTEQIKQYV